MFATSTRSHCDHRKLLEDELGVDFSKTAVAYEARDGLPAELGREAMAVMFREGAPPGMTAAVTRRLRASLIGEPRVLDSHLVDRVEAGRQGVRCRGWTRKTCRPSPGDPRPLDFRPCMILHGHLRLKQRSHPSSLVEAPAPCRYTSRWPHGTRPSRSRGCSVRYWPMPSQEAL